VIILFLEKNQTILRTQIKKTEKRSLEQKSKRYERIKHRRESSTIIITKHAAVEPAEPVEPEPAEHHNDELEPELPRDIATQTYTSTIKANKLMKRKDFQIKQRKKTILRLQDDLIKEIEIWF